jgi:ubiquinone/menaquinone biosynthesis C-methylase UbiE
VNRIFGGNTDGKSGLGFRVMSLMLAIRDKFTSPWSLLDEFGIERGQTVVDYGCGPGSYLRRASELVGPGGRVFAVDSQDLAVKAARRRIEKERLNNVTAVQAAGQRVSLPSETADVVYALDMFHMVSDPGAFLRELNRICKRTGSLFIDNGHQSRGEARLKLKSSGAWEICEEKERYLKCSPVKGNGESSGEPPGISLAPRSSAA